MKQATKRNRIVLRLIQAMRKRKSPVMGCLASETPLPGHVVRTDRN